MSRKVTLTARAGGAVAIVVAFVTAIFFFVFRAGHPNSVAGALAAGAAEKAAPARAAAVYLVGRHDLTRTQTLSAELHPYAVTDLYAKVSGYLRTIDVDYGSRVGAGETVATLELPEQEADLARTRTALDLAKLDYDRVRSVNASNPGAIPQQDIDKARAAYQTAQDERNRAQTVMDYTAIIAPYAGVVTKRFVDPGALIQAGVSSSQVMPVVQISDNYRLRLVIETPESIVPEIHVGTPVTVRVAGLGRTIVAPVARYSYDVHEETRTMHTEVDIDNPDLVLKPGMYADVTLDLQRHDGVLAVPTQALSTGGSPNVWVVDGHDELRERPVTIGLQTPNWVEIKGGLHAGDRVFFGDRSALTLGMRVIPKLVASLQNGS